MLVISLKDNIKGIKPDSIKDVSINLKLTTLLTERLNSIFTANDTDDTIDYLRSKDSFIICFKGNRLLSIAFNTNMIKGLNLRYDYWKVPIINLISKFEIDNKIIYKYFKTNEYF